MCGSDSVPVPRNICRSQYLHRVCDLNVFKFLEFPIVSLISVTKDCSGQRTIFPIVIVRASPSID